MVRVMLASAMVSQVALAADAGVVLSEDFENPAWTASLGPLNSSCLNGANTVQRQTNCRPNISAAACARLVDSNTVGSGLCEVALHGRNLGLRGLAYGRMWVNVTYSGSGADFTEIFSLHRTDSTAPNLALDVLGTPPFAVQVQGRVANSAQPETNTSGSPMMTAASWNLVELMIEGLGTTTGRRRAFVNGTTVGDRSNLDFTIAEFNGAGIDLAIAGFTFGIPNSGTGTLLMDSVRFGTVMQASTFRLVTPQPVVNGQCQRLTIEFLDALGRPAPLGANTPVRLSAHPTFSDPACMSPSAVFTAALGDVVGSAYLRGVSLDGGGAEVLVTVDDLWPIAGIALPFRVVDSGVVADAGLDAGTPDSGVPDGGADAGPPDAGQTDAGDTDAGTDGGAVAFLEPFASAGKCGEPYRLTSSGRASVTGAQVTAFRSEAEAGSLPEGFSIDEKTGFVSWVPSGAGVERFTVVASTPQGELRRQAEVTVQCERACGCSARSAGGVAGWAAALGVLHALRGRRRRSTRG